MLRTRLYRLGVPPIEVVTWVISAASQQIVLDGVQVFSDLACCWSLPWQFILYVKLVVIHIRKETLRQGAETEQADGDQTGILRRARRCGETAPSSVRCAVPGSNCFRRGSPLLFPFTFSLLSASTGRA